MKYVVFSLLFAFAAQGAINPVEVEIALDKVYVPVGFDTNDVPQVYVTGKLPDTCHQVSETKVEYDQLTRRITLRQKALKYDGPTCWPVAIPFDHAVTLPILEDVGDYALVDAFNGRGLGTLPVEEALTGGPGKDNFHYAPVEEAALVRQLGQGHNLILTGHFPNSCFKMKSVRVLYQKEVLVALPIVDFDASAGPCSSTKVPFFEVVTLTQLLAQHPYLVHVRSMNGKSLNRLVDPYGRSPITLTP